MKSLRGKPARTQTHAWRQRSSQLGLYYLLAITLTYGTLFRLIFLFYAQTTDCYPGWEFWLSGWHQMTSLFQTVIACNLGLAGLITIDCVARWRSLGSLKFRSIIIYAFLLAYPFGLTFVLFTFYGAMIPSSQAGPVYEKTKGLILAQYSFGDAYYWGIPEGPFGSCRTSPMRILKSAPRPAIIDAL